MCTDSQTGRPCGKTFKTKDSLIRHHTGRHPKHVAAHPDCQNCQLNFQMAANSVVVAAVSDVEAPRLHGISLLNEMMGMLQDSSMVSSSTRESWHHRQRFNERIAGLAMTEAQSKVFSSLFQPCQTDMNRAKAYLRQISAGIQVATLPLLLAVQQSAQTPARQFTAITSASADLKYATTLAVFLHFAIGWTQGHISCVSDALMKTLTDRNPVHGKVSTLEAFLLYLVNHNYKPDDFQHACVHLKYSLRGTAMLHCTAHITPARTSGWCRKWLSATDDLCVAWTWLQEEKKWAAFYSRIEPKPDTVRWTTETWSPIEVFTGQSWVPITKMQMQNLLRSLFVMILDDFAVLGIPVVATDCVIQDQPRASRTQGIGTFNTHLWGGIDAPKSRVGAEETARRCSHIEVGLGLLTSISGGGLHRFTDVARSKASGC
jgi:hypothetical protein